MQVDRHPSERAAPLNHRSVIVRVRDRDRLNAAQTIEQIDGGVVDQRDALPQDVARRRACQDCPLPDTEGRRGLDRHKSRCETAEFVAVGAAQLFQRGPGLARCGNELSLVGASRARIGWTIGRRVWPPQAVQMKAGMRIL